MTFCRASEGLKEQDTEYDCFIPVSVLEAGEGRPSAVSVGMLFVNENGESLRLGRTLFCCSSGRIPGLCLEFNDV